MVSMALTDVAISKIRGMIQTGELGPGDRLPRARVWRGLIEGNAARSTVDEHEAIYRALRARDQPVAQAAARLHVNTSESGLRTVLSET
jgi:GntR family transcriptional repressor for pyruvate dehydrogenase complex